MTEEVLELLLDREKGLTLHGIFWLGSCKRELSLEGRKQEWKERAGTGSGKGMIDI